MPNAARRLLVEAVGSEARREHERRSRVLLPLSMDAGASLSGAATWRTLLRIGSRSSGVATIRSKSANGPPGRPSCTSRVRPPDWARIQRATGALRWPLVIRTSGQGGASGADPRGIEAAGRGPEDPGAQAREWPERQPLLLESPAQRRADPARLAVGCLAFAGERPDQMGFRAA